MIPFKKYRYIYPPRPESKVRHTELLKYDNNMFLGQPKLNGSNCTVYTNGVEVYIMNRHKRELTNVKIGKSVFTNLHRGKGWMVLNGEYMNKAKKNKNGLEFNHKFVIFDILVYNGKQTIGTTFEERVDLLKNLYDSNGYDTIIRKINDDIYIVETFFGEFNDIYGDITLVDMYEGFVLKKKKSKLKNGITQNNNSGSQIKVRKPTKNYDF
jgi:ATP-dependent DNA ligase